MSNKRGFTLIELLVVIAIIALLLSIVAPALKNAKKYATSAACLSNQKGLSTAYYLYAENNDSWLVDPRPEEDSECWVNPPHDGGDPRYYTYHNSSVSDKENGIMTGALFKYSGSTKIYHCPSDKRFTVPVFSGKGPYRSYSIPEGPNGGLGRLELSNGLVVYEIEKYSEFISPGDKYIFVEENYTHGPGTDTSGPPDVGYNVGVWSFWSGDIYTSWWDPLAPWHNDKSTLGYADGHAEKWIWKDQRTIDFAYDRMSVPYNQPGNPDQEYMTRAYPCRR